MAAAVVDVGVVAGEASVVKIQGLITGNALQQYSGIVVPEQVAAVHVVVGVFAAGIEVKPHRIVLKDAVFHVHPGISVAQYAGTPPGKMAASEVNPGGGGYSCASTVSHKI